MPSHLQKIIRFIAPSLYNDRVLRPQRQQHSGQQIEKNKIAIFLIFPTNGIQESHLYSLQYMVENGYSPFVVSNLPLSDTDLAKLIPIAWRIMVRQNFGYDFGGYRDAILDLQDKLDQTDCLVLFNDSTWFPIPGGMNWLACAQSNSENFVGSIMGGFAGRVSIQNFKKFEWKSNKSSRKFYYGSFAILIKNPILKTVDFLRFWKKLRLSQGKYRTCRRGETGFTQWVMKIGHSHAATSDHSGFDKFLMNSPDSEKRRMLNNVILAQDKKVKKYLERKNIQTNSEKFDISLVTALLLTIVARRSLGSLLPEVMLKKYKYSFLKKSLAKTGDETFILTERIVNNLADPMRSIITAEMRRGE